MRKRLMGTLLITAIVIGASPISVSADWKQQSNNTWGWKENGKVITYEKRYK